MTGVFLPLLLTLGALYLVLILVFILGLGLLRPGSDPETPTLTVVVPAHNEAAHLADCLKSLAAQTYLPAHIEIIVVDDRSTDTTVQVAKSWSGRLPGLRIVPVEQAHHACPKKNALAHGIWASRGELILVTDADCRPSPGWIASTVRCFDPKVGMVFGYAPLVWQGGLRNGLLALQSLAVAALSAGSAGIGFPLSCSGRNLAYRRVAFQESGGFDPIGHILGGDDVLLMRQIAAKTAWKIRFNPDVAASVPSDPHPDWQFHRQVRYQSKAIHYGTPVLILALAVYIFHLLLGIGPFWAGLNLSLWSLLGPVLAVKILADGLLLGSAALRFENPVVLCWFPVLECLLIPYVVVFCALGVLKPARWN